MPFFLLNSDATFTYTSRTLPTVCRHEKEVNDPDMLTAREAERVEARRKDKAAKEAEILAKIEAMSP